MNQTTKSPSYGTLVTKLLHKPTDTTV